jgi:hypothetical protein
MCTCDEQCMASTVDWCRRPASGTGAVVSPAYCAVHTGPWRTWLVPTACLPRNSISIDICCTLHAASRGQAPARCCQALPYLQSIILLLQALVPGAQLLSSVLGLSLQGCRGASGAATQPASMSTCGAEPVRMLASGRGWIWGWFSVCTSALHSPGLWQSPPRCPTAAV